MRCRPMLSLRSFRSLFEAVYPDALPVCLLTMGVHLLRVLSFCLFEALPLAGSAVHGFVFCFWG